MWANKTTPLKRVMVVMTSLFEPQVRVKHNTSKHQVPVPLVFHEISVQVNIAKITIFSVTMPTRFVWQIPLLEGGGGVFLFIVLFFLCSLCPYMPQLPITNQCIAQFVSSVCHLRLLLQDYDM